MGFRFGYFGFAGYLSFDVARLLQNFTSYFGVSVCKPVVRMKSVKFRKHLKTRASRTTGAKGSNSFARNNRLQITDNHMERIRLQVSAKNK